MVLSSIAKTAITAIILFLSVTVSIGQNDSALEATINQTATPATTETVVSRPIFRFPIKPMYRPLDHQEEHNETGPAIMRMAYPAVSDIQNNKYSELQLLGNTVEYFTTVLIGTPGRPFSLQVDTGSAITALPSIDCPNCYNYNPKYNASQSSTSNVLSCADARCTSGKCNEDGTCSFYVSYGDTSYIQGKLVSDVVSLPLNWTARQGLATGGNTTIENLHSTIYSNTPIIFGSMTSQSTNFQLLGVDGIMGFSFGGTSLSCVPNCATLFLDAIVQSHGIRDVFAISLERVSNNSRYNIDGGSLTIGGYDDDLIGQNGIFYTPILKKPYYSVALGDVAVGGVSIGGDLSLFGSTIVDSGTTYLLLPNRAYHQLKSVFQTNYCHLPFVCTQPSMFDDNQCINSSKIDLSQFPDLTFSFDGVKVIMRPDQYLTQSTTIRGSVNCFSIVQSGSQKTILGGTFMRGVYTIFDRANMQIGFTSDRTGADGQPVVTQGPAIKSPSTNLPIYIAVGAGVGALLVIIAAVIITWQVVKRRAVVKAESTVDIGVAVSGEV